MNGNDKNFIIAIAITMLVLLIYPKVMMRLFPQSFTPDQKVFQQQPVFDQGHRQEKLETFNEAHSDTIYSNATHSNITYSPEKSYIIGNNLFTLKINSPQGDISQVSLLNYIDPATEEPTVVLDTKNIEPGVFSLSGDLSSQKLKNVEVGNNAIAFHYIGQNGLAVKKVISVIPDLYKINSDIEISNSSDTDREVSYRVIAASGIKVQEGINSRYQEIRNILEDEKQQKKVPSKLKGVERLQGKIKISALKNRYFSFAMIPLPVADYTLSSKKIGDNSESTISHEIGIEKLLIPGKSSVVANYALYCGPNDSELMSHLNLEVEQIRGKGIFAGFSDFLLMLMRFFHKMLRNYGLAVIALSLIINIFLYPLTFKSLKSMKEMQALQPLVEKLRTDLKDKPDKLNKEIMELYRKHKVNPLGGCLPMVFQIPVFFSLYKVLMQAVELRGASFLWIKDLSGPDAFISLSNSLPVIGNTINLLPLVMVVLSFVQQKLTNPSQTNEQQKMMALFFPVFMGFIFYKFPSGLVLYFLTNTVFSIAMQTFVLSKVRTGEE